MGQLTAGVAHEIKNPLNFVKNFAAVAAQLASDLGEVLRESERSRGDRLDREVWDLLEELDRATSRIVEHGGRADDIVTGMMLRARQGPAAPEPLDLNRLLEECCDLAAHGAQSGIGDLTVQVERTLSPDLPTTVLDAQGISRVLVNLLNNAFDAVGERAKSAPSGYSPTLWVGTSRSDASVELRIRDNGGGVAPDALERIFEPFFTTKPAGGGTGLGLSMSRDLLEEQGGGLRVESVWGEGADFIVTLPIRSS